MQQHHAVCKACTSWCVTLNIYRILHFFRALRHASWTPRDDDDLMMVVDQSTTSSSYTPVTVRGTFFRSQLGPNGHRNYATRVASLAWAYISIGLARALRMSGCLMLFLLLCCWNLCQSQSEMMLRWLVRWLVWWTMNVGIIDGMRSFCFDTDLRKRCVRITVFFFFCTSLFLSYKFGIKPPNRTEYSFSQ